MLRNMVVTRVWTGSQWAWCSRKAEGLKSYGYYPKALSPIFLLYINKTRAPGNYEVRVAKRKANHLVSGSLGFSTGKLRRLNHNIQSLSHSQSPLQLKSHNEVRNVPSTPPKHTHFYTSAPQLPSDGRTSWSTRPEVFTTHQSWVWQFPGGRAKTVSAIMNDNNS